MGGTRPRASADALKAIAAHAATHGKTILSTSLTVPGSFRFPMPPCASLQLSWRRFWQIPSVPSFRVFRDTEAEADGRAFV